MPPITCHNYRAAGLGLILILGGGCSLAPESDPTIGAGSLRRTGTIRLDVTCDPSVAQDFDAAVALLHAFFYTEARRRFEDIAARDPECAMAYWGIAMTCYHPLFEEPSPDDVAVAANAIDRANAIARGTKLERGMIHAIASYFGTESAPRIAFREAWKELHERFPANVEVAAFYALATLATASPADPTRAKQRAAIAILEPRLVRHSDHPGVVHYLIHACDHPELATRGLKAARQYDETAPWAPYALHVPSRIYTRRGYWRESIESNVASVAAARDYSKRFLEGATSADDLLAQHYLIYAYLQTAQDEQANRILAHVTAIERIAPEGASTSASVLGAIVARGVLEQKRWRDAATLRFPPAELTSRSPFTTAPIEFARAVGGARSGQLEIAATAVAHLEALRRDTASLAHRTWVDQVEILHLAASAWLAHARDENAAAEKLLRQAAALEDQGTTHPSWPGPILPVREQLGELLLEIDRPALALIEFELALKAFPKRFRSLLGAGRAAEGLHLHVAARRHYENLVEIAGPRGQRREALLTARRFLRQL